MSFNPTLGRLLASSALSASLVGCTSLLGSFEPASTTSDGSISIDGSGGDDSGPGAHGGNDGSSVGDGASSDLGDGSTSSGDSGSKSGAGDSGADGTVEGGAGGNDGSPYCTFPSTGCYGDSKELCSDAGVWLDAGPCPGPQVGNGAGTCGANSCTIACASSTTPNLCNGSDCVNLEGDPRNCGSCGYDCTALPNVGNPTAVTCVSGVCTFTNACTTGYAHCSGDAPDSGCGTAVGTNTNCGGCGMACDAGSFCGEDDAGSWACSSGCSGATPNACSGVGCVDLSSNHDHCGTCGTVCAGDETCLDGGCGGECGPGESDCSGNVPWTCDAGEKVLGNDCSVGNAGTCVAGRCVGACTSGVTECYQGGAGANIQTCIATGSAYAWQDGGACQAPAAGGSGTGYSTCTNALTCGAPTCDSDSHSCNGSTACWSNSDVTHCGSSCAVCTVSGAGSPTCVNGECAQSCPLTTCSNGCFDLMSDPNNCGACGYSCGGGACDAGTCEPWVVLSPTTTPAITAAALFATDGTNVIWYESSSKPIIQQTTLIKPGTPIALGTVATGAPSTLAVAGNYVWSWLSISDLDNAIYNAQIGDAGSWTLQSAYDDTITPGNPRIGTSASSKFYKYLGVQPPEGSYGAFAYVASTETNSGDPSLDFDGIQTCPGGSGGGVAYSPSSTPAALFADTKYVYFVADNGTTPSLFEAPVGNSTATPLALPTADTSAVSSIVTNGGYVAWVNSNVIWSLAETAPSDAGVAMTPTSVEQTTSGTIPVIAADGKYLYYGVSGTIGYALASGVAGGGGSLAMPPFANTPTIGSIAVAANPLGTFIVWNDTENNAICAVRAPK